MINNISWQGYWIFLAITIAIYYLLIYLLYYRNGLKISWHIKLHDNNPIVDKFYSATQKKTGASELQETSFVEDANDFQRPSIESDEYVVYACMDELTAFYEEAKRSKWEREDLIRSLQMILTKYPAIKKSPFKDSVTNVLVAQCEHIFSIRLSAADLVGVWSG